jgi:hypothetical protein
MTNTSQKTLPLISLIAYLIGFLLIKSIFSPPGNFIFFYIILSFICFIPIFLGNKTCRMLGGIALAFALIMASVDYFEGIRYREHIRKAQIKSIKKYISNINTNSEMLNVNSEKLPVKKY